MFGLVRKKTHREVLRLWGEAEHAWRANEASLHALLAEKDKLINSTERAKVLADLESALLLIQAYQRALSMVSASDPNIIKANALLEKWGKQGDPHATYLGASNSRDLMGKVPEGYGRTSEREAPQTRWEREEEEWGDEAYGTATVRIEAEAVDEGDDKEPGYTRARIRFVDTDVKDPAPVATEE